MADSTSVPLSKKKLLAPLFIGIAFVALGLWLFSLSDAEISLQRRFNPPFVRGLAIATMVLFGLIVFWTLGKLFDTSPGLVLNDKGLIDNTNMLSIGFVAWTEILAIEVRQIKSQPLLYVILREPERFIAARGFIKRTLLRAFLMLGPGPVTITSHSLIISFDELVTLMSAYLSKYRNT